MNERNTKKTFIVSRDMDIEGLSDEQLGQLFRAMLDHANGREAIIKDPEVKGIWRNTKRMMDISEERYQKKCEQNSRNATRRWNYARKSQKTKEADSDKSEEPKDPISNQIEDVVSYLNQKRKVHYVPTPASSKLIYDRLEEGFTVKDLKTVIDKKCKEWTGTKFENMIRPETLFSDEHFQSYLNQKEVVAGKKRKDDPVETSDATDEDIERIMKAQKGGD